MTSTLPSSFRAASFYQPVSNALPLYRLFSNSPILIQSRVSFFLSDPEDSLPLTYALRPFWMFSCRLAAITHVLIYLYDERLRRRKICWIIG